MITVTITAGEIALTATFNDSETAYQIGAALPIVGQANLWGDEIYFEIPVDLDEAPDALTEVEVGTLAYWPVGNAFCIFFGRTPVSQNSNPRAYSPVNVFGHIMGDATVFRTVKRGATITVTANN